MNLENLSSKASQYLGVEPEHIEIMMDYYNKHCVEYVKPERRYKMAWGDNWCAMFTSFIAHLCGLSPKNFPYEVSVFYQWQWAIANKRISKEPIINGLIVYNWPNVAGRYNHVGIVKRVVGDFIHVVEGNYNGTVGIRKVNKNSPHIEGYIRVG